MQKDHNKENNSILNKNEIPNRDSFIKSNNIRNDSTLELIDFNNLGNSNIKNKKENNINILNNHSIKSSKELNNNNNNNKYFLDSFNPSDDNKNYNKEITSKNIQKLVIPAYYKKEKDSKNKKKENKKKNNFHISKSK